MANLPSVVIVGVFGHGDDSKWGSGCDLKGFYNSAGAVLGVERRSADCTF